MAPAISRLSSGSTVKAASPTTSGNELAFVVTTGVPQAIASSGPRPNPSCLLGKATVIAKAGDARYAFHRGEKWLGAPQNQRWGRRPSRQRPKVDYDGYLRKQNRMMQESYQKGWDEKRRNARRGVQVQQAR